jgi:hypothetical protein
MVENIIVLLIFLGAVAYVGQMIYRSFRSRSGCSQGCGKCAIDFDKISRDIQSRKA